MSAISEFTGVSAMGTSMASTTSPVRRRRTVLQQQRRKKDAIAEFIESAPSAVAPEPAAVTATPIATPAPVPVTTPAPKDDEPPTPAPTPTSEGRVAIMVSREVVEALTAGRTVNVRGVILEPTFKPTKPAVAPAAVEAAETALVAATSQSIVEGGGADMHAPQGAVHTSDGKTLASAVRRFHVG